MKVLVFGLGRSGQMLLHYFKDKASLWIYDDKEIDLSELRKTLPGLDFYDPDEDYDLLALSPGPQPDHWLIEEFKNKGIPVIGEMGLALKNIKGRVIAVTGTNGKTTTTSLIYEMIRKVHPRTFIGGNIGIPMIGYVDSSQDGDVYVVELSSFQLESLADFSPEISVILNITPDHINWHGSMEKYVDSKFNLWKEDSSELIKVINADQDFLVDQTKKRYGDLEGFYCFSTKKILNRGAYLDRGALYLNVKGKEKLLNADEVQLKGEHNMANALAASMIARLHGLGLDPIKQVLREFRSLEHRYELLEDRRGRRFINDSKATNVDSALPAIRSATSPTVLIAGGLDKKVPMETLFENLNPSIKEVILFGQCKDYMYNLAKGLVSAHRVADLDEAFNLAMELSDEGWDILFSPACASWDMYESFEKRGQHFKELHGGLNE